MPLKQTITDDMKTAMKARAMDRLTVLRSLLSEIKNFEIDNGEQDDAGVQKVVAKMVKQIKESIAEYGKGGRQDLVDEEEAKWLLAKIQSDGKLDKIELTLLNNLKAKSKQLPQSLLNLLK